MNFDGIRALTFDCYGTLIDWESGILGVLNPWAKRNSVSVSDEELLADFAEFEPACEHQTPDALYPDILRAVFRRIATRHDIAFVQSDADHFAMSVGAWCPFPDTVAALARLKRRFKLAIVSNVDAKSISRSVSLLQTEFDAIVTAEEVGVYKPDHRMFHRAFAKLGELGVERGEIVHIAQSLYHDHVPAKALGMKTVWVDRNASATGGATRTPDADVFPDLTVRTLAEFADVVGL